MTTFNRRNPISKPKRPPLCDKTNLRHVHVEKQTKPLKQVSTQRKDVNAIRSNEDNLKMRNRPNSKSGLKMGKSKKVIKHGESAKLAPIEATKTNPRRKDDQVVNSNVVKMRKLPKTALVNISQTPRFMKTLRKRKVKNYAELSMGKSSTSILEESPPAETLKKLPVYLQSNLTEHKEVTSDPFEFVPDSPKKKKQKVNDGQENSSSESDSNAYDKSMHKVLKDVRRKEKMKNLKKKRQQKTVLMSDPKVRIDNEAALKNEIKERTIRNRNVIGRLNKQIRFFQHQLLTYSDRNFHIDPRINENNNEEYFGFNDDASDDVTSVIPSIPKTSSTKFLSNIQPIGKKSKKFTDLTSTPLPPSRETTSTPVKSDSKHVNIISDVLITPPSRSISSATEILALSNNKEPERVDNNNFCGFNTTISRSGSGTSLHSRSQTFNNVSSAKHCSSTPWRSDNLCVRRNPHILYLKDTSLLPSYNQEMVLEPDLLERRSFQSVNDEQQTKKVQISILDFVTSSSPARTPSRRNTTLFDEGDFSPIKSKMTTRSSNKENAGAQLFSSNNNNNKKKVNARKALSPLKPSNKIDDLVTNYNVDNYFGFESPGVDNNGNKRSTVTRTERRIQFNRDQNAGPMRVPAKLIKEIREEAAEKLADEIDLGQCDYSKEAEDEVEEDAPSVGLFEDPEDVKVPERVYARKRTKRVRVVSVDSEIGEVEEKPKKKRKDVRTPAEEEEFKKWVNKFNAMCEEVDKHNLEIA